MKSLILDTYTAIETEIIKKLSAFRQIWEEKDDLKIYKELLFCLLTPQSKAENAWEIIKNLERKNLLFEAKENILKDELRMVRFRNNKAKYIRNAQRLFVKDGKAKIVDTLKGFKNSFEAREWLVKNVKGLGYKEASHFLRNIGLGEDLTILDRHILNALLKFGVIDKLPKTLTRKRYIEIEEKMRDFSKGLGIPLSHLDFVFWQIQTERIFK